MLILICFFVIIDFCLVIDLILPFIKCKKNNSNYKIRFVAPKLQYVVLFFSFLGAIYFIISFIKYNHMNNLIFLNLIIIIGTEVLSKSFILFCKDGLYLNGTFFTYEEKKEGQFIKKIKLWYRRIYAIKTSNKYAYIYSSKRYADKLINTDVIYYE